MFAGKAGAFVAKGGKVFHVEKMVTKSKQKIRNNFYINIWIPFKGNVLFTFFYFWEDWILLMLKPHQNKIFFKCLPLALCKNERLFNNGKREAVSLIRCFDDSL